MTLPDTHDWVPGQSAIADDRLLLQTALVGVPSPYSSGTFDVSVWDSITCVFGFIPQAAGQFVDVQIVWGDITTNTLIDNITIGGTGNPLGALHLVEAVIPCRARICEINMTGDASNPVVFLSVVGSTRQASQITVHNEVESAPGVPFAAIGEAVGAASTVTHYVGPFSTACELFFSSTSALVTAHLFLVALVAGVWTPYRIGELGTTATPALLGVFRVPLSVIRLDLVNTDAAGHSWSGSIVACN